MFGKVWLTLALANCNNQLFNTRAVCMSRRPKLAAAWPAATAWPGRPAGCCPNAASPAGVRKGPFQGDLT
eukprot:5495642-Alexandrium_andersonii.AAC.1